MNEQTKKIYEEIIHKLYELADIYHGMWIDFLSGPIPLKGMAAFSYNESGERWRSAKKIIEYLIKNRDVKPELSALPQPITAYNDPATALATALEHEKALLQFIQINIGESDIVEHNMMQRIYNYAHKEHNEVQDVQRKIAIPGADLWSIDSYLCEMYCDKEKYEH